MEIYGKRGEDDVSGADTIHRVNPPKAWGIREKGKTKKEKEKKAEARSRPPSASPRLGSMAHSLYLL